MSTRMRGAVLALVAAALVGAALPLPWWSGHPVQGTRTIDSMTVDIGVKGFEGCRGVGGADATCEYHEHTGASKRWSPGSTFAALGFATLGAALLALVLLLAEAVAAVTGAVALRRKLAVVAMVACGLAAVAGASQQRVHERSAAVPGRGMHHQAGRLVDDEHGAVLVRDSQRDRLRLERLVRWRGQLDADALAAAEPVAGPAPASVDQRPAITDETLRVRPADARQRRHRDVNPSCGRWSLDRPVRGHHVPASPCVRLSSANVR